MSDEMSTRDRVLRIIIGVIVTSIGLFMFWYMNMWPGLIVAMLGIIPLSTGLLGSCPTIPMSG
jgi:hypothetical protein